MKILHRYHILEESIAGIITSLGLGGVLTGLVNMFSGGSSRCLNLGLIILFMGSWHWIYEMRTESTHLGEHSKTVVRGLKVGWILWIFSEILIFASMFLSYYYITFEGNIFTGRKEPGLGVVIADWWSIPSWNTVLLTILGISMLGWEKNLGGNRRRLSVLDFVWTGIIMWVFLMSQYYEFYNGLSSMSDGAYGSIYYGLVGLHGIHCITGELMIIYTGIRLLKYEYDEENHNNIWACGINVHFLMGAWIFIFLLIYL